MIVREPVPRIEPSNAVQKLGQDFIGVIAEVGKASLICSGAFANMRYAMTRRSRREIVRQIHVCAVKSLPVVSVVAFFIGMILALQIGIELRRYNQEVYIGSAVMVSLLREMGPFMSGIVLAACVGSSMAAQIGTIQDTTTASVEALRAIVQQIQQLESTSVSIAAAVDQQSVAGQDLARSIDLAARSSDEVAANIGQYEGALRGCEGEAANVYFLQQHLCCFLYH